MKSSVWSVRWSVTWVLERMLNGMRHCCVRVHFVVQNAVIAPHFTGKQTALHCVSAIVCECNTYYVPRLRRGSRALAFMRRLGVPSFVVAARAARVVKSSAIYLAG